MTAVAGSCSAVVDGIGAKQCISGNVIKMLKKGVLLRPGFSFASFADYADEDKWNEAIAAGNAYVLEGFKDIEDASTEEVVIDTASGDKIFNRASKRGFIGYMDMTLAQNKILQDYGTISWTIAFIDDAENIIATTPDGVTVKGLSISYFNPKPMQIALGSDQYSRSVIEMQLEYNDELDKQPCLVLGSAIDWIPSKLEPTTVVEVTNVSILAGVITASFNIVDRTIASLPTTAIRTLTAVNLSIIDQAGAVAAVDSIVETTTPGTYTIDVTISAMTGGTIQQIATATSLLYSAIEVVA